MCRIEHGWQVLNQLQMSGGSLGGSGFDSTKLFGCICPACVTPGKAKTKRSCLVPSKRSAGVFGGEGRKEWGSALMKVPQVTQCIRGRHPQCAMKCASCVYIYI